MNYEVVFDGKQYAISVQDIDRDKYERIMAILNDAVEARVPTYDEVAHYAYSLNSDNKIMAIKALRSGTGMSLKEAKCIMDHHFGASVELPEWINEPVVFGAR